MINLPVLGLVAALGEPLLHLFLGRSFFGAWTAFAILVFGGGAMSLDIPITQVLLAKKRTKVLAVQQLVSSLTLGSLALLLIPRFYLDGAALAYVLARIVCFVVVGFSVYRLGLFSVKWRDYIESLGVTGAMVAATLVFESYTHFSTYMLPLYVLAGSVLGLVVARSIGLLHGEDYSEVVDFFPPGLGASWRGSGRLSASRRLAGTLRPRVHAPHITAPRSSTTGKSQMPGCTHLLRGATPRLSAAPRLPTDVCWIICFPMCLLRRRGHRGPGGVSELIHDFGLLYRVVPRGLHHAFMASRVLFLIALSDDGVCLLLVTRNEAGKAVELLRDLRGVVDEVVLVDSSDSWRPELFGEALDWFGHTHVFRLPPLGLAELYRPIALSKACSEWVLLLDSDERINGALKRNLRGILGEGSADAYMIQRQPVDGSRSDGLTVKLRAPWYKKRLFRRSKTRFFGLVHEQPTVEGRVQPLPAEYSITHYVDREAYWSKVRRYIKLEVFLDRWSYDRFGGGSTLRRWAMSVYLGSRGLAPTDEVSPSDLLLIKRLGAKGVAKLTYKPSEYLKRKLKLLSSLDPDLRRLSYAVWMDIRSFRGAVPYLGLESESTWSRLWGSYNRMQLKPDDFFIYKLVERFYDRLPDHSLRLDPFEALVALNTAADKVFPEAATTQVGGGQSLGVTTRRTPLTPTPPPPNHVTRGRRPTSMGSEAEDAHTM